MTTGIPDDRYPFVIGGQSVDVPLTPLNAGTWSQLPFHPRVRVDDQRMRIEFLRGVRVLGAIAVVLGLIQLVLGCFALIHNWPLAAKVVLLVNGSILPIIGLSLFALVTSHEFVRAEGMYRRRALLSPTSFPLATIVAVQIVRGDDVEEPLESGPPNRRPSYQLNLVLFDGELRRHSLFCGCDYPSMAEVGHSLEGFLKVPLHEKLETPP